MYKSLLAALVAAFVLSSCQQAPPGSDAEDERNPFFRQASKDVADLNYPAAIKQFEKAIATNPTVVKAYLQIGLLYGDKLGDPISAIYFFQKYLEARPNAAEREEVLAAMQKAKIDFSMGQNNSGLQNEAEIAKMSKENIDLKQQVTQLQGTLAAKEVQLSQIAGAATPPTGKPPPQHVPAPFSSAHSQKTPLLCLRFAYFGVCTKHGSTPQSCMSGANLPLVHTCALCRFKNALHPIKDGKNTNNGGRCP